MAPAVSSNDDNYKANLAVYTNPAHDLKVVKTDIPQPGQGEVLIHVKATGICGR
jgi:L-iditol 2-dehydrogenase